MGHWKILSATIVGRQNDLLTSTHSRMAKTETLWPCLQPFNKILLCNSFFFFPFVSFPFHGSFYINSWQLKVVSYFRKSSILDVLQGSEYASEWKIWKHEDSKNRNKQQVLKTKNRTVFLGLSERWKNILKICARGDTLYDIIAGSCYVKKLHWKFYPIRW